MKQLRQQVTHGGTHDHINIIACLVLVVYNSIDVFLKDYTLLGGLSYIAPFLLYPIMSIIFKKRNISVYMYLFVGLGVIISSVDNNSISGLVYMFFSYNEKQSTKYGVIIILLSYLALTVRFIVLGTYGSEAVVTIILFSFIFISFYCKFLKPLKERGIKQPNITDREKEILKLYASGHDYNQIDHLLKLNIDKHSIRKIITRVRDQSGCVNDIQFGKWLYDKG